MIDDSGSDPILMDLGSVAPSPIPVTPTPSPSKSKTPPPNTQPSPTAPPSSSTSTPAASSTPRPTSGLSDVPSSPASSASLPLRCDPTRPAELSTCASSAATGASATRLPEEPSARTAFRSQRPRLLLAARALPTMSLPSVSQSRRLFAAVSRSRPTRDLTLISSLLWLKTFWNNFPTMAINWMKHRAFNELHALEYWSSTGCWISGMVHIRQLDGWLHFVCSVCIH